MPRRSLINPPSTGRYQPELKNYDVSGSCGILVTNGWSELDCINIIPNGSSATTRVGRKVVLKSLLVRWVAATSTPDVPIRVLVIYDKNPDGSLPLIADVLSFDSFNAPMNLGNTDRFVILSDEITPTITGTPGTQKCGKLYKKLNLPEMFLSSTGVVADISTGAIYIMCSLFPGGVGQGIGYTARVRFTDV